MRDLLAGKSRFGEFAASPERIAPNILTDRLRRLAQWGVIQTTPSDVREGTVRYAITPKGLTLVPILESIRDWGLSHIPGTRAHITTRPDQDKRAN